MCLWSSTGAYCDVLEWSWGEKEISSSTLMSSGCHLRFVKASNENFQKIPRKIWHSKRWKISIFFLEDNWECQRVKTLKLFKYWYELISSHFFHTSQHLITFCNKVFARLLAIFISTDYSCVRQKISLKCTRKSHVPVDKNW